MRSEGRITGKTWDEWRAGIKWALDLSAFKLALEMIKAADELCFDELRRFERENFESDPIHWKKL